MDPQRLFFVVFLPGAICTACLVAWALTLGSDDTPKPDEPARLPWGGAAGYLVACLVGTYFVFGRWPALKTTREGDWLPYATSTGEGWLPYLAIASVIVWLATSPARAPHAVRSLAGGLISIAVVVLVLRPMIANEWNGGLQRAFWIVGLGTAVAITWASLRGLQRTQTDGWSLPLIMWLCAAGASMVQIVSSASAAMGELFATLSACFGASVVVGAWKGTRFDRGALHVAMVYFSGLLLAGYFFGTRDSFIPPLLVALAPSAAWIGRIRPIARRRAWQRATIQAVAVAIPIALAIVVGILTTPVDPYSGY